MENVISIGNQGFDDIRDKKCFYIDKTSFIKEWWSSNDVITLINRPRRFGKTLNMSMVNCFFSNTYKGRSELFEGLDIWKYEEYRNIQGKYPVIFISFAAVKADNITDAKKQIKAQIANIYNDNRYILDGDSLSTNEKKTFENVSIDMGDVEAAMSINDLCRYLERYHSRKVIVLLDEYDTPMQEAYINGYWNELAAFMRSMFNATFKTNTCLERAIMTGITRISKESIFSDLNNLKVVTCMSDEYAESFGFTEREVYASLCQMGLEHDFDNVKSWYDGFTFGSHKDIYNPWSITNYLKEKKILPYWASTSSNGLANNLIRISSSAIKEQMEDLLKNNEIEVTFDEQIVFNQLDTDENAIWSLLVASGYLKVENTEYIGIMREPRYHLRITNMETYSMFMNMFKGWFNNSIANYNGFVKALLAGNIKDMNSYMNEVALATFSSFDAGTHPGGRTQPERFYHGFVLGLLVELRDIYEVKSNKESGYGRYDVCLIPKHKNNDAIIMEFKVLDVSEEKCLEDTVRAAHKQIEDKCYDAELTERGINKNNIRHYGFAFEGKKVLIG